MKKILLLFLITSSLCAFAQPKSYDYAYLNKKGICVYSITEKKEYLISTTGQDPALSPDGTKLAYTDNGKNSDRFIVVIDLATKKKMILDTHNSNCYGAVWSTDGKMLAYNIFLGAKWAIAVINADNTGARILGKNTEGCYSPVWIPDSRIIMLQDGTNLKLVDLNGQVEKTVSLGTLDGGLPELKGMVGNASSDRFVLTPNQQQIIFCTGTNDPGESDGPPDAVFIYDVASKKTLRLTHKGYSADEVALSGNTVLFTISKLKSSVFSISQVDIDGKNYKILFPGCSSVSAKLKHNYGEGL
jgi:hypothetical protein